MNASTKTRPIKRDSTTSTTSTSATVPAVAKIKRTSTASNGKRDSGASSNGVGRVRQITPKTTPTTTTSKAHEADSKAKIPKKPSSLHIKNDSLGSADAHVDTASPSVSSSTSQTQPQRTSGTASSTSAPAQRNATPKASASQVDDSSARGNPSTRDDSSAPATPRPEAALTKSELDSTFEEGFLNVDKVTDLITDPDDQIEAGMRLIKEAYYGRKLGSMGRLLEEQKSAMYAELYKAQEDKNSLENQLKEERKRIQMIEEEKSSMVREIAALRRESKASLLGDHSSYPFHGDVVDVRAYLREQAPPERQRLLRIFLEACFPGDIPAMQRILSQYVTATIDILSMLPNGLHVNVLRRLSLKDLLNCRLVNRAWLHLVHDPRLWKAKCLALTKDDPVPVVPPPKESDWEDLYKGLYCRERNWAQGLVQRITFLKGHTNFVTSLKLRGRRLVTGSYDETVRVWSLDKAEPECIRILQAKAISCVDFLPDEGVIAGGFHDLGRVLVWSTATGEILETMQGHNRGIRALCMNSDYLVSAGQDKTIVVWEWRTGTKRVVFGQQTNLCLGVQLVDVDKVVAITIDGVIRTFDVTTREMLGQFKIPDPAVSSAIGGLSWFAAHGYGTTCGTSRVIYHLEWDERVDATKAMIKPDLTSEPKIVDRRVCSTDVHTGATDPIKKRVIVATRFTSRSSSEKSIYVSTVDKGMTKWKGEWARLSLELARSERNPMVIEMDHENAVIGTSDGTVYICSFVGTAM